MQKYAGDVPILAEMNHISIKVQRKFRSNLTGSHLAISKVVHDDHGVDEDGQSEDG